MASALPDVTSVTCITPKDSESQKDTTSSNDGQDGKQPELTWEMEDARLAIVGQEDRLPCVGQFEADGQLSQGLKVYSNQPFMLYSRANRRQARARTIYKDPSGVYFEIGQTLIIPEDYSGWFELVPSDFNRASCYLSVDAVAKVMPPRFFTRSNLKGIRIEGEGEQQKYLERKIPSGSVLRTNGIFKAKWKTRAETGMLKKKTTEWEMEEITYLRCVDHDDCEVLVPVTHKGKFNAIYERGKLAPNAVYSMKDILSDLTLPIKVRLLYGKAPVVPCIFTGMLIVRETSLDDVIVCSTILNKRNVLFDLPVDAPVKVKTTSSDVHFAEMATYKDAQRLCRKYAHLYSSMIKLSPDLDTGQKVIQHVPSDPSVMRESDEALRALDLITDISLTSEPVDHLLDGSDTGSLDQQTVMPAGARLSDQSEYDFKSRESHTHV